MRKGDRVVVVAAQDRQEWFAGKVGVIIEPCSEVGEVGVRFAKDKPVVWFLPKELRYDQGNK